MCVLFFLVVGMCCSSSLAHDSFLYTPPTPLHSLCSSNVRELRRRLEKEGLPAHPLLGPDPEQWRKDAKRARNSRRDQKSVHKLRNMMVGH
jgi:hypothetical protein